MKISKNACTHVRKYLGDAEYVIPFYGEPWNAWMVWGNGFMKPSTGLYYKVLLHLENCKEIDEELRKRVKEEIEEIEKKLEKLRDC